MQPTPTGGRLVVRHNPVAYLSRLSLVLFFTVVSGLAPFFIDDVGRGQLRFYGAAVVLLLAWALVLAHRLRDRRPQVVVDHDGLHVRQWHLGTVAWNDIALVAISSALRRPLAARVFRRRLGDHIVVRFRRYPAFQPSVPPPLSWGQRLLHELDNSDPAIMPARLDASAADILAAIEGHLAPRQTIARRAQATGRQAP